MQKSKKSEKFFLISSLIVLTVATIQSFILPPEELTIIPKPEWTIPIINSVCTVLCIINFFFPKKILLESTILFIQSISTILTGYEILGTFLYITSIILLFCNGFFKTYSKKKAIIFTIIWFIISLGIIPYGVHRFFLLESVFLFFIGFHIYVYDQIKDLISPLLSPQISSTTINLIPGSILNISNYGLTERQKELLFNLYNKNFTYSQLAEENHISKSLVKKEMSIINHIFGVQSSSQLVQLLNQYVIVFNQKS